MTDFAGISNAQVQEVLKAIQEVDTQPDMGPARFRCSSGVVLRLRKIPPFILKEVQASFRPPEVPKVYMDDKETSEENPSDPTYMRALRAYQSALGDALNGVMLVRGTEVESVPDGMPRPEDNSWVDDLNDLPGVENGALAVPNTPRRRYYCWLKYVALTDSRDLTGLLRKLSELAGNTLEVDVARAVESFPDNSTWHADTGISTAPSNGLGNTDQPAAAGSGA